MRIKREEKKLMTHEISWETQPHSHISPSIMIKVTHFLKPHHMIRLQTQWTFVFYSFSFPYSLRLSLPLLFLPQFSNKQQSPSTIFQQLKKKQKQMQMHMQKPEADLWFFGNHQTCVRFWKLGNLIAVRKVHWKFKISDFGSLKNRNDGRFPIKISGFQNHGED